LANILRGSTNTVRSYLNVPLADLLYRIMGQELIEDPSDILFTVTNYFLQLHSMQVTYFLSAYLIFWGIIDIFLSTSLLKHKMWAFPVSLWLIAFLYYMNSIASYIHIH
jgi:uncharacterized membrane protein